MAEYYSIETYFANHVLPEESFDTFAIYIITLKIIRNIPK